MPEWEQSTSLFVTNSNKFYITWQAFFRGRAERISQDIIAFFCENLTIKSTAFMQMELKF